MMTFLQSRVAIGPSMHHQKKKTVETVPRARQGRAVKTIANNGENILTNANLSNVVRERQRYNISTRATASLLNAFLNDINMASEENIIDRNKIIRETTKFNSSCEQTHQQKITDGGEKCIGLFFDGKKDKTNVVVQNSSTMRNHPRKQEENH